MEEEEGGQADGQASPAGAAAAAEGEATAAQASSGVARQLLDGELLKELVGLHARVYGALDAAAQPGGGDASVAATGADTTAGAIGGGSSGGSRPGGADDGAWVQSSFLRSYELGAELLAAAAGQLGCGVDDATATGHLYRLCLEHIALDRAAASTAAVAVAARRPSRRSVAKGAGVLAAGDEEEGSGFDMQGPCVEEITLLQVGVGAAVGLCRGLITLM